MHDPIAGCMNPLQAKTPSYPLKPSENYKFWREIGSYGRQTRSVLIAQKIKFSIKDFLSKCHRRKQNERLTAIRF